MTIWALRSRSLSLRQRGRPHAQHPPLQHTVRPLHPYSYQKLRQAELGACGGTLPPPAPGLVATTSRTQATIVHFQAPEWQNPEPAQTVRLARTTTTAKRGLVNCFGCFWPENTYVLYPPKAPIDVAQYWVLEPLLRGYKL